MRLNETAKTIQPSGIREFFDIVSTMPEALSLGVGEPDFVTPWGIRNSAIKSIQKGYTAYTSNRGLLELRKELSIYLKNRFMVEYDPNDEIMITNGASEGIDLALRSLVNPGEGVIVPTPCYISYSPIVNLCGGKIIPVKCEEKNQFKVLPNELEIAAKKGGKVLILSYPNNPTGAIMTEADLRKLIPVVQKYDLMIISDEIYAELTYVGTHKCVAAIEEFKDRTILVSGFSKSFAMTGWRLGYACAPKDASNAMYKIHQYTALCSPTASQYAGLEALREGKEDNYSTISSMREEYNKRRRFLSEELNALGITTISPDGAFYIFANVKVSGQTGREFANGLLKQQKVAVVPGEVFGEGCEYFIRMSYATSLKIISESVKRIEKYLMEIKG